MQKHIGKCQFNGCGRDNQSRMPVRIGNTLRLICERHGASSRAVYDIMDAEQTRRARIYRYPEYYNISLMAKGTVFQDGSYGYYGKGGRRKFKNLETAKRYCDEFIKNA